MGELWKVLDFIQERAALLRYGSITVPNSENSLLLQDAFQRYNIAQQIIERNEPDTYADGNVSEGNSFPSSTVSTMRGERVVKRMITKHERNGLGQVMTSGLKCNLQKS